MCFNKISLSTKSPDSHECELCVELMEIRKKQPQEVDRRYIKGRIWTCTLGLSADIRGPRVLFDLDVDCDFWFSAIRTQQSHPCGLALEHKNSEFPEG